MTAQRGEAGHPVVIAVVVTHQPQPQDLDALLAALAPQVRRVIVVDNASSVDVAALLPPPAAAVTELHRLTENLGLAHAQNVGIARALALGADFVLLSDQDSLPAPTLVAELLAAWNTAQAAGGATVAAVGPATVDRRSLQPSFFWRRGALLPYRWRPAADAREAVEVEFLIASGTLIPAPVLRAVGGMRSGYFIDHVDTEWCFRARAAGHRLLAAPAARLQHRLGDRVDRVWCFGWRQVMHHAPLRDYYMFRNTLLLLADTEVPPFWRVQLRTRLLQFAAYFLLWAPLRRERLALMGLGLRHGWAGAAGRLDPRTGRCQAIPPSELDPPG